MYIPLLLLVFCYTLGIVTCSPGCQGNCVSDYTCKGTCGDTYDNDNTCLHCTFTDPKDTTKPIYLSSAKTCIKAPNRIQKTSWLPPSNKITELILGNKIAVLLNSKSDIDHSFCYNKNPYRLGKWFKVDMSKITKDQLILSLKKTSECLSDIEVDITNSQENASSGYCLSYTLLNSSYTTRDIQSPKVSPFGVYGTDSFNYYIYISISDICELNLEIEIKEGVGKQFESFKDITQQDVDSLYSDLSSSLDIVFSFKSQGFFGFPICLKDKLFKVILFTVNFTGNFNLALDGRKVNRNHYLTEYNKFTLENGTQKTECVSLWSGERHGFLASDLKNGVLVKISSSPHIRYFALLSEEMNAEMELLVSVICPDNCGENDPNGIRGTCSTIDKKCICKDGFGGDDCHSLCFFNGTWQTNTNYDLCYFGTRNCDQYCHCTSGNVLSNHLCLSAECFAGNIGPNDECYASNEGCMANCRCAITQGFKKSTNGTCANTACGNGKIDKYFDVYSKYIRTESCDNGTHCTPHCICEEGYITNPKDEFSCYKKTLPVREIIGMIVVFGGLTIVTIVIVIVIVRCGMRYRRTDIDVFKQQQPIYHFYIAGSTRVFPSKEAKYKIDPIDLDFGNLNTATTISDTRFEKMEIKNYSKNKYMMVIFHTPNNPKYVFHFEPQVVIIPPRRGSVPMITYMTLNCTTKIRDMKIPYTIWFSKSKSTLTNISEVLKDKDFETWSVDDEQKMSNLRKGVVRQMHHNLTIKTDAASSTFIDMDELNMSEKPIAEGAMGRVYIGSYRSVPVAVKQFRWENLDEEEVSELKKEVTSECEIMSKLRNPFIASYMGSVTYIPQVSMVIQFFVLGSLGEYLTPDKSDFIKMPYKLKVRMLFDTSRGMQFLHENRIMHLDLKPDNLLVNSLDPNSACSIKITDFGTSRFTKKTIKNNEDRGLGTPIYAAPETFKDEYTFAGDVYSFAITSWQVFYQVEPYNELKSVFDIKKHVEEGKRLLVDEKMPKYYSEMVVNCWDQDPSKRPTFDQVSRCFIAINDDVENRSDLDADVSLDKIDSLIATRNQRLRKNLDEIQKDF
ncbi:serine-threonine protein kinase, putative [Entamoeba invadens IP1]|uniref:Serine-threonine protein kinase, putative n=1 Tax=Entamoeba invadens IP1 TaxID=370355 RepID=A0A0A1TV02_ENTIV|nr:serine-threonine protein kinase, putative [Entamoeba invadens IP1]ELP84062.1 serine-threonine protein kinase, putative [Entamoeba invadens IP1]|eukprot:XP_004183408.1 serine-threonine protein kinase, putative [Entamoeba invadens IP1]